MVTPVVVVGIDVSHLKQGEQVATPEILPTNQENFNINGVPWTDMAAQTKSGVHPYHLLACYLNSLISLGSHVATLKNFQYIV